MVTMYISRFGMVTMETDVEELLSLVLNTGRDIDEAVVQLQTMTEVVKRGVQQAQDELKRESDNQIWQEGILRLDIHKTYLKKGIEPMPQTLISNPYIFVQTINSVCLNNLSLKYQRFVPSCCTDIGLEHN